VLSSQTGGRVVALDLHRPFLRTVQARARREGRSRVFPLHASMEALPFPSGRFDLVWGEGALYNVGFDRGLAICREALKPGGHLAATEVIWLEADPPAEVRAWWEAEYPAIGSLEANLRMIEAGGFRLLGNFTLPESAWWAYYRPLETRLATLRQAHEGDPEALEVIEDAQIEIDLFRRHGRSYGYEFFVCRKD
jgi:SAM-dependent methyltransferase